MEAKPDINENIQVVSKKWDQTVEAKSYIKVHKDIPMRKNQRVKVKLDIKENIQVKSI